MRRTGLQLEQDLIGELETVLTQVGLDVEEFSEAEIALPPGVDTGVDAVLRVNGQFVAIEVKSIVTAAHASQLLDLARAIPGPLLVVANRIASEARSRLQENDIGYYDARGHVRLVLPGVFNEPGSPW